MTIAIDNAIPYVILLDMIGTTYAFYENRKGKNQERKYTRAYANFPQISAREDAELRPKCMWCSNSLYNKPDELQHMVRVHTLVE